MDKTISTDYEDLSELLFGEGNCYNSNEVRKRMYGMKHLIDVIESESLEKVADDKILKKIEERQHELQKERYKLQATKVEYMRKLRQESRFELFYEQVKEAIQILPTPEFKTLYKELDLDKEYVLCLADIHVGANFKSINNEYSVELCKERFNILLGKVFEYIDTFKISKMKVLNLGDTIQGLLRITDLQLNEISIVEATVTAAKLIASFLNTLSQKCEVEFYNVPSSNHNNLRLLNSKANELANEDVDYIITNYISDVLADNKRIKVFSNFGHDYIEIPIFDFNVIALHGHTMKDLVSSVKDLSFLHNKFWSYCISAHRHAGNDLTFAEGETHDMNILVCPSFVGSDPFSDSIKKGSKSSVNLFTFDEKYGHTSTEKFILA